MTGEEIRQYLKERNIPITSLEANSIIEGVKLADETHGKELMYAIQKTGERTKREYINKACEILTRMICEVTYKDLEDNSVEHYDKMEFIEDFKKAMEE